MVEKYRTFNNKRYTFSREFDTRWKAENAADRISHKANIRILKVVSRAPPQGDVFYRLYYRMYESER